jgi:hypothetical protein
MELVLAVAVLSYNGQQNFFVQNNERDLRINRAHF